MKTLIYRSLIRAAALVIVTAGLASSANAAFIAYICDDALCTGGGDTIVVDQGVGDNFPGSAAVGQINAGALNVGGFTIVTNVATRTNTAATSLLDLTFSAVTNDSNTHTVFLYISDTGFTAQGPFAFALSGTQAPPNSGNVVTGRAFGGTSNTNLDLSRSLGTVSSSATPFGSSGTGPFASLVNPYSLTLGVQITRGAAGTTTGDFNISVSASPTAVPEPGSIALLGVGLASLLMARRARGARASV